MSLHSFSPSSPRIALLPVTLLSLSLLAAAAGCDGESTCADCNVGGGGGEGGEGGSTASNNGGSGTGTSTCDSTLGTLAGKVYEFSGPPNGQLLPNATIIIQSSPEATPLYGEADETGAFSIPLEAGQWLIGGEHMNGCQTSMPLTIQLDPCETEALDLVLEFCADGL